MFQNDNLRKKIKFKLKSKVKDRLSAVFYRDIELPQYNLNIINKQKSKSKSAIIWNDSRNKKDKKNIMNINSNIEKSFIKNSSINESDSLFKLLKPKTIYSQQEIKIFSLKNKPVLQSPKFGKISLNIGKNFTNKQKFFVNNKKENSEKIFYLSQRVYDKNFVDYLKRDKKSSLDSKRNNFLKTFLTKYKKESIKTNIKDIKKEEKRKLYQIEMKDTIEEPFFQMRKIKKLILTFLTKETNINEIIKHENFYKSFVNRIRTEERKLN